ncbi:MULTISPECIES: hypothetical protein [Sorangium]|uniref:Secreted protein n=1 Tax=Sorangium cellulosum TaxID=56 RepID=A0A4V0NI08_SORCE|nr:MULTISPECIES: hypothetical protein [Sorangium]AUX38522.1 hypothetical protein SOCE836_107660 [Sorangium cellulosum]WCQ97808.1 hypothetical protein NQZ70_10606 [Sorangium sp. Soce836]
MKKIARWALAFAAVMSVSGSAMAVREDCGYSVTISNGIRKIPAGVAGFALSEQVGDLFNDGCIYAGRWGVTAVPGAATFANLFIHQTTTMGMPDCVANSYSYAGGAISLVPGPVVSYGIDSRYQKARLATCVGMEDDWNGVIKLVCQYHTPMSLPYPVTFTPSISPGHP